MTQASFNRGADYSRNTAEDLASKASDQIERVVSGVEQTARNLADQGRQAGEQVGVVADNFKSAVDKSVKDQPLTTLAVAAAVGFVIGALWKS
ncbi:MAG: hypothetical protein Q7T86_00300 [Hyphomicrobiaceae bacterium]|jgi:ElaB/YqjD/DUF883 family membrane-anchored ribosome-binding protein|nr:hypothetical protein [Hyphomicrobiaceae bacterium]